MKQFTTPGIVETRQIMVKMKVKKSAKKVGRANLENIKAKLEAKDGKCKG